MNQLADPAFGAKILGSQDEFNRLRNIVNDPAMVGQQFQRSKGAMSFRGTAGYANRKPGDYTPIPGKSNFYFDSDPRVLKQGTNIFNSVGIPQQSPVTPPRPAATPSLTSTPRPVVPPLTSTPGVPTALPSVDSVLSTLGLISPKTEEKKSFAQDFALGFIRSVLPSVFGTAP
jgi:hypothetical protein